MQFSWLNRLSVRNRLRAIVAIFIGSIVLGSAIHVLMLRDTLQQEKETKTRQLVESAFGVLVHYHDLQSRGELSADAARAAAIGTLRAMRYDGKEYYWLNDLGRPYPKMIMHPILPELEGQVLDAERFNRATRMRVGRTGDFVATDGHQNLFAAFTQVVGQGGEGYVTYDWPKPRAEGGVSAELYPKLSYVKKFEPWGWVIGSGVYMDDVAGAVAARAWHHVMLAAGLSAVLLLLASLVARSITRPLRMTMAAMREIGDGQPGHRLPVAGRSEIAELAGGFNHMLDCLQARDAALARHQGELEAEVARRTAELREANGHLAEELAGRGKMEQALRESRARMRALLDASGETVLLMEPDGTILTINAIGAKRFGLAPGNMEGANFFHLLPDDLSESRRAAVEHAAATGEPMHVQDQRGGLSFDNSLYPVKDETGAVESIAVYAKDITEQRRAEQTEDIFRRLDTMLLKWQMNLESIAHMFCDEIMLVYGFVAAWIGRAEKDGRLVLVAGAEGGAGGFLDVLRTAELRWEENTDLCLPAGIAIRSGCRQNIRIDSPDCQHCHASGCAIGARSALVLPLILRGETWGMVAFYGRDPDSFDNVKLPAQLATIACRLGITLEAALQQEWLNLLDTALAGVDNAVLITDADGCIQWANQSYAELSGFDSDELVGQQPRIFGSGAQDAAFYREFWQTIKAGRTWHGELVNVRRDGSRYTCHQTVTPLLDQVGEVSHYVAIVEDITERKAMEARIQHAAHFDLLTDLPNRGLFFDRLGQTLLMAQRDGHRGGLLFIDLDRFKDVNDCLGHAAGDQLLVAVAERLAGQVRESDTVARLAGDEFTIILPHLADPAGAVRVAEKILAAIAQPLVIAGREMTVGASIGIAFFPEHGLTAEQVLNAADHAMYAAKETGRNRYAVAGAAADRARADSERV